MNRIRLLTEQVANQIAAGEVIERPASVVKELVENALDAQARRLLIEIQSGGRTLIRVTDDGVGMNRDDALLCLERHATSKIRAAEDLTSIATMGFRGEALPSIASVSRMSLTTREREGDAVAATQVIIHGGRIHEVKEASGPSGTCIEVRQLFFNLPARRKFLRSEETERAHIQHYLMLVALAYPQVALTFIQDNRKIWELPGIAPATATGPPLEGVRQRLRELYGSALRWLPVNYTHALSAGPELQADPDETGRETLNVWGFIGAPGVSRGTREDQHLFVNRRPIENRGLNFALLEAYHTALMKGRYPVCCLFLDIDPAAVDVNIHPAKREVRFHREGAVRQGVTEAVRQALLAFHSVKPDASTGPVARNQAESAEAEPVQITWTVPPTVHSVPFGNPSPVRDRESTVSPPAPGPTSDYASFRPSPAEVPGRPDLPGEQVPSPAPAPAPASDSASCAAVPTPTRATAGPPETAGAPLLSVPLRLVGVIGKLYVILESDRGLVLLDQHAAHERVLYEQMLNRLDQGQAPSQRLLLPETIELPPRDTQFLREQLSTLARLGVGLSVFGDRTFLLDSLPPFVKGAEARRFILQIIDELKATGQAVNSWRLGEQMIAKTVCRHAVKANDTLSAPELEKLIEDLRHCSMPYTCPHGRPTLIEMNFRELEKKFGRVV